MKKNIFVGCIIGLLLLFQNSLLAQGPTTQGREFWLTFMLTAEGGVYSPETSVIISAKNGATGTISNPRTGYSTSFSCPAGQVVKIVLPNSECYCGAHSEGSFNRGIFIQASDTISLYAASYMCCLFDATNILPEPALGSDHIIQTYPGHYYGSCFAIVAPQDNTIIDITPSVQTLGGHVAGVPYSITLNRGEAYQVVSQVATADLSGSRIVARDCKKIAVFAGDACTDIPTSGYGCCCDNLYEQIWPTWSWGQDFVITASLNRTADRIRITAANNATQVYVDGALRTTLNAAATYEFEINTTPAAHYISSDKPISVFLYLCDGGYAGSQGDPAMVWITPIQQGIKEVTFGTFPGSSLNQYVNIVVPTSGATTMRMDGNSIASDFNVVPSNPYYSYARKSISNGTYTLKCDSQFVAHVYGLGTIESYAYSAGSAVANLQASLFVNDVNSVDISPFQEYCLGDTIVFRANISGDYENIYWDFGDGATGQGDTCPHLYPTYGSYQVSMVVEWTDQGNSCNDSGFDTLSTPVRILQNDTVLHELVCYGFEYDTNGFYVAACYQDTFITKVYPTIWGCDSVVHLDLDVFPIDPITIPVTICKGDFYLQNGFQIIGQEVGYHTYMHYGTSVDGCDSTTILQVTVKPLPDPYLDELRIACTPKDFPILLNPGDFARYKWSTGETTQVLSVSEPGTYEVTVTSGDGCTASSAITIELHDVSAKITQSVEFCEDLVTTLYVETLAPHVEWSTGETTPEITVYQHGRYSVIAYNDYCETMTAITIEECPFNLFVPNTISPWLEDGKNDYFYISGDLDYIQEMEINIYDRWGKLAYHSTDKNFRWDGKVDGRWIPNNTFSYKLQIITVLNKKYVYKGHINVL